METKFNNFSFPGSGWPSFFDVVDKNNIRCRKDASGGNTQILLLLLDLLLLLQSHLRLLLQSTPAPAPSVNTCSCSFCQHLLLLFHLAPAPAPSVSTCFYSFYLPPLKCSEYASTESHVDTQSYLFLLLLLLLQSVATYCGSSLTPA